MMEGMKTVSRNNWPSCPFRGLPHVSYDYRCPSTFEALPLSVDTKAKDDSPPAEPAKRGRPRLDEVRIKVEPKPTETVSMLVPVARQESYCLKCLKEGIREKDPKPKIYFADKETEDAFNDEVRTRRKRNTKS